MITSGGTTTLGLYDNASEIRKKADITYVDSMVGDVQAQVVSLAGGHLGYATLALATTASTTLPANTVVEVTNDTTTSNNGLYLWNGITLTKSTYDPLTLSKSYTDGYATVKSKTLANATDFNTLNVEGRYIVPSNAAAITMLNFPSTRAGILEVLAISSTQVVQRYTPYGIDKKVFNRASNTGVWPASWEEILLKSEAMSLFATPASVSSAIGSSVDSITQSDYYGKKYSTSELNGSQLYSSGAVVGYNSIYDKDTSFNAVEARVFNPTNGVVEFRVWTGSKVINSSNGYQVSSQSVIANPDFSGVCKSFPNSDTGLSQQIILDKVVSIPKNTPFVIAFRAADSTRFSIAYASSVTGNLENRSFNLNQTQGDWSVLTSIGNAAIATYVQAGFKLLVSIPQSSGGGVTPDDYTPVLVVPPKIYAMSGLETHIYPEHLLVEDYKIYEHDVTCTKGQQRNRGFVWTPTGSDSSGNYALSWSLHDKQKGTQLTSASTNIQLAALNAKSGQTVKALVIGDSLVNAGSITQRLLDIAVDDVMKVQLLGTRGTGLNKHEGRGGWKISDYATEGRSDYKFTVSGVTTVPAINSTTYSFDGRTYLIQETSISGGSGYIVASLYSGAAPSALGVSGTLTKANSGVGDATIAFSNIEAVPANPFWNSSTSSLDFANYLSVNSQAIPDYVFIQLGVNDVFAFTSDQSVIDFTATAFVQLDALISSIKAAAPSVKLAIVTSPSGANQDAFGTNYGCGQTSWRYKRNLVTYNKQLYSYYSGKEAQSVYVVGSGVNVDTENNFPTSSEVINSQNTTIITSQNNGVHPADSGYRQIADGLFPFMKAT